MQPAISLPLPEVETDLDESGIWMETNRHCATRLSDPSVLSVSRWLNIRIFKDIIPRDAFAEVVSASFPRRKRVYWSGPCSGL